MNNGLLAFLAGLAGFWTIALLFRGKSGRVEIYPGALLVRSGLKLEPARSRRAVLAAQVYGWFSFASLAFSAGLFYYYTFKLFALKYVAHQQGVQGFAPLIPGVTLGLEATLYILFAIGVAAFFHESAHALVARGVGIKVKDAGVALFLFIPAAFVELDEEELKKAPLRKKIPVYSAGVGANVILALIFMLIMNHAAVALASGVQIVGVTPGSPASSSGLQPGDVIVAVNGTPVKSYKDLADILDRLHVHDANRTVTFTLTIERGGKPLNITIVKPKGAKMLGVTLKNLYAHSWIITLSFSLYMINLSLALVNAAPLVIPLPGGSLLADGAQILRDTLIPVIGEKAATVATLLVGSGTLVLILSLMSLSKLYLP